MRNALSSELMILCSAAMMGAAVIMVSSDVVFAQGEAAQEVDTTGLEKLGPEWRQTNPYDPANQRPVEIGAAAYNQNCARCHGLTRIIHEGGRRIRRAVGVAQALERT
jgi:mono/diheme cytochrome c family protein